MRLDDLTLAEIESLEEAARMSITEIDNPKAPKGRLMRAIVFVAKRRDDPSYSWEQAGQLTMSEMNAIVAVDDTETVPPTVATRPNG